MQNYSHEYIGSIVLLIVGVFKMFGIELPSEALTGIITGGIALWIAIRRYQKGDITTLGKKI